MEAIINVDAPLWRYVIGDHTAQRGAMHSVIVFLSDNPTAPCTEEGHPVFYMGLGACGLLIIH